MSSKRPSARNNENEDFSLKLRELLTTNKKKKRNAAKLLDETCSHIKRLNGEVDDLSNQISELMASPDTDASTKASIRQLLQQ